MVYDENLDLDLEEDYTDELIDESDLNLLKTIRIDNKIYLLLIDGTWKTIIVDSKEAIELRDSLNV